MLKIQSNKLPYLLAYYKRPHIYTSSSRFVRRILKFYVSLAETLPGNFVAFFKKLTAQLLRPALTFYCYLLKKKSAKYIVYSEGRVHVDGCGVEHPVCIYINAGINFACTFAAIRSAIYFDIRFKKTTLP